MTMDVILCGEVVLFVWIRQLCWTATSGTPNQLRSAGGKQPREGGRDDEGRNMEEEWIMTGIRRREGG